MKEGRYIFHLHTYTWYFLKYHTHATLSTTVCTFKLIESERWGYVYWSLLRKYTDGSRATAGAKNLERDLIQSYKLRSEISMTYFSRTKPSLFPSCTKIDLYDINRDMFWIRRIYRNKLPSCRNLATLYGNLSTGKKLLL